MIPMWLSVIVPPCFPWFAAWFHAYLSNHLSNIDQYRPIILPKNYSNFIIFHPFWFLETVTQNCSVAGTVGEVESKYRSEVDELLVQLATAVSSTHDVTWERRGLEVWVMICLGYDGCKTMTFYFYLFVDVWFHQFHLYFLLYPSVVEHGSGKLPMSNRTILHQSPG